MITSTAGGPENSKPVAFRTSPVSGSLYLPSTMGRLLAACQLGVWISSGCWRENGSGAMLGGLLFVVMVCRLDGLMELIRGEDDY